MNPIEAFTQYAFLREALIAGLVVALVCGILGVFLVLRGMSLLGDGLAHLSFAGIALGIVAGVLPLATAFVVSILGAVLIHVMRERGLVKGDTAIGIIFTGGLAVGVLVISLGHGYASVESYLFGSIIAVGRADVRLTVVLGAALLALVALFYREFVYMTFSEEAAKVSGLPVRFLNLLFVSLTAATIVMAARVTGVLLVSALVIVPAATALQLRRGFHATLVWSALFGLLGVLVGLSLSVLWDTAPGATIAVTSIAGFAVAGTARGLLAGRGAGG